MPTMKFLGPRAPAQDYTEEIILETDGLNVVRSVKVGEVGDFSDEQVSSLSPRYYLEPSGVTSASGSTSAPAPAPTPAPGVAPAPSGG